MSDVNLLESESFPTAKMQKMEDLGVRGDQARELDQFFTTPDVAADCVRKLLSVLRCDLNSFDVLLEPSFGDGAFVRAIRSAGANPKNLIYIDIDARDENLRKDFLKDEIVSPGSRCLTIGNPPFGRNSSLAIAFFNRAAEFSSVIAFILPLTFRKAYAQDKLNRRFFLVFDGIGSNRFLFQGKMHNVPCTFQIWSHVDFLPQMKDARIPLPPISFFSWRDVTRPPPLITRPSLLSIEVPADRMRPILPKIESTPDFVFVGKEGNPDIAIRRVGVNAGQIFDKFAGSHSEQSHYFLRFTEKGRHSHVLLTLRHIGLENTPCKFDTAGCPSIGKTELCGLYMEAAHELDKILLC